MSQNNSIRELTQRVMAIKPRPPLTQNEIDFVADGLGVDFSKEFADICLLYDYEYMLHFNFRSFYCDGHSGVLTETQAARTALGLPNRYVVLAIQDDVSVVLMETQDSPEKPSPVIWCDMFPDFFNICEGKPMEQNPTIWPSFADFFEYLVEQEEAKLKEDA